MNVKKVPAIIINEHYVFYGVRHLMRRYKYIITGAFAMTRLLDLCLNDFAR